jgi:hypothetical protein
MTYTSFASFMEITTQPTSEHDAAPQHVQSLPELLTPAEAIEYLRLDADGCDAAERLRNLVRRQGLPVIRRGRLQRFRRSAIDTWLDGGQRSGRRISNPARLKAIC